MPTSSLLYVSCSKIPAGEVAEAVRRIVETSKAKNPLVGLTGALLCTGSHFAQVLEGKAAAIDALMVRVRSDPRHEDLIVVQYGPIARRQFANWALAYCGPSQFVSNHVTRLLDNSSSFDRRRAARWLSDLIVEFSAD